MRIPELALGALVAWSVIGLVGTRLSWRRGDRSKARRGLLSILVVWLAYLTVLLTVSHTQPGRRLALGEDECFGSVCYAVVAAEDLPGFSGRPGPGTPTPERLLRVSVRVLNRDSVGRSARPGLRAYLIDSTGHTLTPVPGLSGVRLDAPVLAGQPVLSRPVFRIPAGNPALALVLTERPWTPALLEIGNTDSWRHRPAIFPLTPATPAGSVPAP